MKHFYLKSFLILLCVCNNLQVVSAVTIDGINYSLKGDSAIVTGCSDNKMGVFVPSSISYNGTNYIVTDIAANAFYGKSFFQASIDEGVKRIGYQAFAKCSNLYTISMPNSIESIGQWAFNGCNDLNAVIFPNFDITSWCSHPHPYLIELSGGHLYTNYSSREEITSIAIPNNITNISDYTFEGFKYLESIVIPNSVTSIGNYAFSGCSALTSIIIPESVTAIEAHAFENCDNVKYILLSSNINRIGDDAFKGCSKLDIVLSYDIDSWFNITFGTGPSNPLSMAHTLGRATSIAGSIFYEVIEDLVIPTSISEIKDYALFGCQCITSLLLPSSIKRIEQSAFEGCTNLKKVSFDSEFSYYTRGWRQDVWGDDVLEYYAQDYPSFASIFGQQVEEYQIGNNVRTLKGTFYGSDNLKTITINCEEIDKWFSNLPSITTIKLGNNVKKIGYNAFHDCAGLASINIPEGLTEIGIASFSGCSSLQEIIFPQSVTAIGNYAFQDCNSLKTISIPQSVLSIGAGTFSGCTNLSNIHIPNSVKDIKYQAFYGCKSLTDITIPSSITSIGSEAFSGCDKLEKVIVPDLSAWCNIDFTVGGDYLNPNTSNPLSLAHHLYSDENTEIVDLIIPDGTDRISATAFYGADNLKSVSIPSSIKSIEEFAFYGCSNLSKTIVPDIASWCGIEFGDNPLSMAEHLYRDKETEIKDLVIPLGVKSVASYSFMGANELTSISIPNTVQSIGNAAFYNCGNLKSLVIPNGVQSIGESAFSDCSNLESLIIPNSVKTIGEDAFANCMSLYSVTSLINMPFKLNESAFRYTGEDYNTNVIYMAATLYVPRGKMAMYKMTDGWMNFLNVMETDTKFKLTYMVDGEVYKTYEIQAAEIITPEPDPIKEGFDFSGWSKIPYLMPAEDIIISGSFTPGVGVHDAMDDNGAKKKEYYDLQGRHLNTPVKGINIIRSTDGTTRKVLVK